MAQPGIHRLFAFVVWIFVKGPRQTIQWVRARSSNAAAALWLIGMVTFVVLTTHRALGLHLADRRARIEATQAHEAKRVDQDVLRHLEKKPLPRDAGSDGRPPKVAARAPSSQVIELLDIDEIEQARAGSDKSAKEAIAGLQEVYEGEDGGVNDVPDGGIPLETITIKGKDGEDVTIRMKQGGFSGWIQRNMKYRKRRLGDKETLEIMLGVTGGVGTKVDVQQNSPVGGLAAIAAIRGSAQAEARETNVRKEDLTTVPGLEVSDASPPPSPAAGKALALPLGSTAKSKADGGPAPATTVRSETAPIPLTFGALEVELLGVAAVIAITSPAEESSPVPPVPSVGDKVARPAGSRLALALALDELASRFSPLVEKNPMSLSMTRNNDHLVLRLSSPSRHRTTPAAIPIEFGTLVRDIAGVVVKVPGSSVELDVLGDFAWAGKKEPLGKRQAAAQLFLDAVKAELVAGGLNPAAVVGAVKTAEVRASRRPVKPFDGPVEIRVFPLQTKREKAN